jgi:hypothetical protein
VLVAVINKGLSYITAVAVKDKELVVPYALRFLLCVAIKYLFKLCYA